MIKKKQRFMEEKLNIGDIVTIVGDISFCDEQGNDTMKLKGREGRVVMPFTDYGGRQSCLVQLDECTAPFYVSVLELKEKAPEPEPEPQAKTVSQEEYFSEVSTLNGKIRQLEQQCADERQKTDREKAKVEQMLHRSVGCLDAVKAMLESSGGGATHRMRDFYAEAMVKFIGNAKATLQSYAEPEPF